MMASESRETAHVCLCVYCFFEEDLILGCSSHLG